MGLLWGLWELWSCDLASTSELLGLGLKGHIFMESFILKKDLFLFYEDGWCSPRGQRRVLIPGTEDEVGCEYHVDAGTQPQFQWWCSLCS